MECVETNNRNTVRWEGISKYQGFDIKVDCEIGDVKAWYVWMSHQGRD